MILSVDPGTSVCGVALWTTGGKLIQAGAIREVSQPPPIRKLLLVDAVKAWVNKWGFTDGSVVVECPQTYDGRASRGDGNDLIALAEVVGALAYALVDRKTIELVEVSPSTWKRQIPKPENVNEPYIATERVLKRLTEEEQTNVVWVPNKRHCWDIADSLAIGLWFLKRW